MPDVFVSDEKKQELHEREAESFEKVNSGRQLPFLSSFCQNPTGIEFVNQEPGEKIILFLRRHFINNLSWITWGIVLLFLPIILVFPVNLLDFIEPVIPFRFIVIFLAFYYLIIIGFVFTNFVTWFYNVGIVTTKQIIDIDFTDIMYREVAKARIEDVIDVEYTQGGFLRSFFDYGHVFIQTEGIKPNFEFHSIPNPDRTTDIIIDLKGDRNSNA